MRTIKPQLTIIFILLGMLAVNINLKAGYDPSQGRFIKRDPIDEKGFQLLHGIKGDGIKGTVEQYTFVKNNSIDNWDFLGLLSQNTISKILQKLEKCTKGKGKKYTFSGKNATELLFGTALVESNLVHRKQIGGGPALGLFQMEPKTHDDIWKNYLRYREILCICMKKLFGTASSKTLIKNDDYATVMARLKYYRVKEKLPATGNLKKQAKYWKKYYNTSKGKGTVQKYIDSWNNHHKSKK